MPPQAQNQPRRQGLGDLNAWYMREVSSGEIWSAFLPPGFQLEQALWGHIQAGLTHDKLQAFEARLNHWGRQLMGAHRWDQVYAVANAVLGPGCYELGAVMGIGLELHQMEKQLVGAAEAILQKKTLELGKVFVLAGMYEAAHPSRLGMMAMAAAPTTWTFWAAAKVLDPFVGADMKTADVRVRKMLQEVYAIASDPKKLLGDAWGSMKKEYVDKWNRYVQLSKQAGLVNQFEAGEIAGGVLVEVALTVWAIVSGAEVIAAGARAAVGVSRALFTLGAEEFAAMTRGSASIARAEAPEIVKFLEEGSAAAKGGGGAGADGAAGAEGAKAPPPPPKPPTPPFSPVDYDHILGADYTKAGKPTGGHSLVKGNVQVVPGTETVPDVSGVYQATIQVPDPKNPGSWITKTSNKSANSMFPKSWDESQIKSEVDAAWNSPSKVITGDKWTSTTPSGVMVEGYLSPRTTVYPIYQGPPAP